MPKVDETPELVGVADADLLPPPSVPVALKLPIFWPEAAEVWFAQADAQFAIKSITVSKTKFYHTVASLPQDVAAQILDLIRAPPVGDPYEVLKEHLTTLYSLNNYQRFEALVSLPLTGDQKPSHLMNRMLALLADDYKPDFILRGLFLCCLPIEVRSHLLQEKISDPRALALKTDILFQSRVSSPVNLLAEQFEEAQVSTVPPRPGLLQQLNVLRLLLHHCVLLLQFLVGITSNMEPKLNTVENPARSWKTNSLAGGSSFPTCRFL